MLTDLEPEALLPLRLDEDAFAFDLDSPLVDGLALCFFSLAVEQVVH